jgi:hypothetical protein
MAMFNSHVKLPEGSYGWNHVKHGGFTRYGLGRQNVLVIWLLILGTTAVKQRIHPRRPSEIAENPGKSHPNILNIPVLSCFMVTHMGSSCFIPYPTRFFLVFFFVGSSPGDPVLPHSPWIPSGKHTKSINKLLNMAIEIVDLPSYKIVISHSYVAVYQRASVAQQSFYFGDCSPVN